MVVYCEEAIKDDKSVTGNSKFDELQDKLMYFRDGRDDLTDKIDFIICLGGDGTLLYASSLFQQSVPPVMGKSTLFHLTKIMFQLLSLVWFSCACIKVVRILIIICIAFNFSVSFGFIGLLNPFPFWQFWRESYKCSRR